MIRIIDTFAKENVDPSPPVGWWDKLRLMFHGQNTIKVSGGGELRVRVLGSFNPYAYTKMSASASSVDICANQGIHIELGGDPDENRDIVIECGQLTFELSAGASEMVDNRNELARLNGGVRLAVGMKFNASKLQKRRGHQNWRRHCDISLRSPEFCTNDESVFLYFCVKI